MASASKPKAVRKAAGPSHRPTLSLQKTEILINVYDLLPPGRLASMLWTCGGSLLHSGVVIRDREYAYGGHDRHGVSGVYWTKPRLDPPGGTFRCEILQGFTLRTTEELDEIIREASQRFLGTSYNLLTNNCNHFTSYLCEKLTSRPAPAWVNRAARIGLALPCVVPREWIAPPEYDAVDGALVDEEEDERTAMLRNDQERYTRSSIDEQQNWNAEMDRISSSNRSSRNSKRSSTRKESSRQRSLRESSNSSSNSKVASFSERPKLARQSTT